MNESLENITLRWMREGLTDSEAREIALEEIEFYTEDDEKPTWKGPDDRVQEYL